MSTKQKELQDGLANLSAEDRARLLTLAALAGTPLDELLPLVLRDGFAECEESLLVSLEAEVYFKTHRGVDDAEVMASAECLIDTHAKRQRRTG
ncbi:hypothetical protein ACFOLJ_04665 [Rugamonas sp. CCM 8940]|uniref:hypothetical protein n=1 Tax=Rugamonas sp. CCM 8940 TaxID=2765359 RepID=UPI0018F40959|nr:hypothetical protein [Rugamonas sp. CCM 8940]MBJ7314133.1 hypothetical protein [Rugamonas sp. CCM 8940]